METLSALQAFMRAVHWWPVDSPHKTPVTQSVYISCIVSLNKLLNEELPVIYDVMTFNLHNWNAFDRCRLPSSPQGPWDLSMLLQRHAKGPSNQTSKDDLHGMLLYHGIVRGFKSPRTLSFTGTMMTSSNGSFFRATMSLALCAGNSPVTGEFPSQRASNADFDISLMWVLINC